MKTFSSLFIILALAVTLAACGGGGGGGSTPEPPPAPTGTLTATVGCVVPKDGTSCPGSVAFTTENAPSVALVVGTTTVSTSVRATNLPVTISVGTTPVSLSFGGSAPATATLTGTCDTGTVNTGGTCKTPPPWYTSVVVLPAEVTHPGITAAVNKLPAGCTAQTQACWRDTLVAGTIKPIASNLVYNGRKILFVPYFRPEGNYNVSALYADDFSPADDGTITGGATGGGGPAWYGGVSGGLLVPVSILPGYCGTYGPTVTNAWTYGLAARCPET